MYLKGRDSVCALQYCNLKQAETAEKKEYGGGQFFLSVLGIKCFSKAIWLPED